MLEESSRKKLKELLPEATETLVVAVSGGADSLALCLLASRYANDNGLTIRAVTVDHGLRADSAKEAAYVGELCAEAKIAHETLVWRHRANSKKNHEAARAARYLLLTDHAKRFPNSVLLTAHHARDQAETVMARLLKGSGLKGLTGMAFASMTREVPLIRPLLGENPETLREYLRAKGVKWIEDPSNADEKFERTRSRNLLAYMENMGFAIAGVNESAKKLASSSAAIDEFVRADALRFTLGNDPPTIDKAAFFEARPFTRSHWLRQTLLELGSKPYPKPFSTIDAVLEILRSPKVDGYEICGCLIKVSGNAIEIAKAPSGGSRRKRGV